MASSSKACRPADARALQPDARPCPLEAEVAARQRQGQGQALRQAGKVGHVPMSRHDAGDAGVLLYPE